MVGFSTEVTMTRSVVLDTEEQPGSSLTVIAYSGWRCRDSEDRAVTERWSTFA